MKDDLIFVSSVSGLADSFPIVPASKMFPNWIKNAFNHYKESEKTLTKTSHIVKCPGIVKVLSAGYIVPMWHDAVIGIDSTKGFGFDCTFPTEFLVKDIFPDKPLIDTQPEEIMQHIPRTWNQSKTFIKINTPWSVIAPPDVKLLFNPIPYPDDSIFEAAVGILDTDESTECNIQGWWNVKHGSQLLPVGYPLVHILPITEKKLNLVVRDATEKDKEWIKKRNYINSFSFYRTPVYKNLLVKTLRKYFSL